MKNWAAHQTKVHLDSSGCGGRQTCGNMRKRPWNKKIRASVQHERSRLWDWSDLRVTTVSTREVKPQNYQQLLSPNIRKPSTHDKQHGTKVVFNTKALAKENPGWVSLTYDLISPAFKSWWDSYLPLMEQKVSGDAPSFFVGQETNSPLWLQRLKRQRW